MWCIMIQKQLYLMSAQTSFQTYWLQERQLTPESIVLLRSRYVDGRQPLTDNNTIQLSMSFAIKSTMCLGTIFIWQRCHVGPSPWVACGCDRRKIARGVTVSMADYGSSDPGSIPSWGHVALHLGDKVSTAVETFSPCGGNSKKFINPKKL
jgi:hypothetical protein